MSWPGLTRQSILRKTSLQRLMDARVKPGHDSCGIFAILWAAQHLLRSRLQRRFAGHDDLDLRSGAGFGFQMDPATQTIGHDVMDDVQAEAGVALVTPGGEERIEHLALDL